ncbi:MAG TPA: hypothetical protein V6C65_10910 [Allocoleopsis sp.]
MIQLTDRQYQQLVASISQIADLAGSQDLSEIVVLTEQVILLLEAAALSQDSPEVITELPE